MRSPAYIFAAREIIAHINSRQLTIAGAKQAWNLCTHEEPALRSAIARKRTRAQIVARLEELIEWLLKFPKGEGDAIEEAHTEALEMNRLFNINKRPSKIHMLNAATGKSFEECNAALLDADCDYAKALAALTRLPTTDHGAPETAKPFDLRRVTITGADRVNLYLDGEKVGAITATPSTVYNGRPKDDPAVVTLNGSRHEFDTETAAIDWARAELKALTASEDAQNAEIMETGGRKALAGIAAAVDALMCVDHDRYPAARQAINQLEDAAQLLTVKQEDAPALKPFTVWVADQVTGDRGYTEFPFICHIDVVNAAAIAEEALSVYRESFGLPREGWHEFSTENGAYVFQVIAGHIPFTSIVNNYDGLSDDDAAYIWDIAK